MNFTEAMSRTATGRIKYRHRVPNPQGGKDLRKHELDLTLLPSGLAHAQFTIEEQFVDWPEMEKASQTLETLVAHMQVKKQGRDTGRNCDVCAFSVSRKFTNISAGEIARKAAGLGISLEKAWYPA